MIFIFKKHFTFYKACVIILLFSPLSRIWEYAAVRSHRPFSVFEGNI